MQRETLSSERLRFRGDWRRNWKVFDGVRWRILEARFRSVALVIRDECVGKNTVTSVGERAGDPALSREARIRSPDPRNTLEMPRIRYQIFVTHIGPPITLLAPSLFLPFSLTRPTSGFSPLRSAHVFRLYTACNIWAPCYLSYSLSRRSRMGCTLHSTGRPLTMLCLIALILPQRHKLSREGPSYTNYCFILLARSTFVPPFSGDRELLDRVSALFSLYVTHLLSFHALQRDVALLKGC